MDRRSVLKQMIWMGAGLAFLPSCVYKQDQVSIQLKNIQINPNEEKFLFSVANLIIPTTDTPGAADVGAHLFALKMVDDCYEKAAGKKFIKGMKSAYDLFEKDSGSSLPKLAMETNDEDLKYFLNEYKGLVTRGFTMSEYVMTKQVIYKLVPGQYKGCVPVSTIANKS